MSLRPKQLSLSQMIQSGWKATKTKSNSSNSPPIHLKSHGTKRPLSRESTPTKRTPKRLKVPKPIPEDVLWIAQHAERLFRAGKANTDILTIQAPPHLECQCASTHTIMEHHLTRKGQWNERRGLIKYANRLDEIGLSEDAFEFFSKPFTSSESYDQDSEMSTPGPSSRKTGEIPLAGHIQVTTNASEAQSLVPPLAGSKEHPNGPPLLSSNSSIESWLSLFRDQDGQTESTNRADLPIDPRLNFNKAQRLFGSVPNSRIRSTTSTPLLSSKSSSESWLDLFDDQNQQTKPANRPNLSANRQLDNRTTWNGISGVSSKTSTQKEDVLDEKTIEDVNLEQAWNDFIHYT